MLKISDIPKISPIGLLKILVYSGLILLIYYSTLDWLINYDWNREEYSYCIIIPFFVLYLLWERRKILKKVPSCNSFIGFAPMLVGTLLYWVGELSGELFSMYLSLWFVIIGLIWINMGWNKIKAMSFPLILLLTMFPLPVLVNNNINFKLRLISSNIAVKIMHLLKIPAYREGNIIELSFTTLQVVDACSGLKYSLAMTILALVIGYLFTKKLWKRIFIVLLSVPLAIVFNSFRIVVAGILYKYFGKEVAEGFFHSFSGWVVFICAFVVLLLIMKLLKKMSPSEEKKKWKNIISNIECSEKKQKLKDKIIDTQRNVDQNHEIIKQNSLLRNYFTRRKDVQSLLSTVFLGSITILLFTYAISYWVDFHGMVPIKITLSDFPLTINNWTGQRSELDAEVVNALDLNDYALIDYMDPSKKVINFYVAYYSNQTKGKSTHSPESCLPGSGWEFKNNKIIKVALNDGNSFIYINRAYIINAGMKRVVYFWFPMRGRNLTSIYQVKIYNLVDAVIKNRTDGALVRLITTIYDGEKVKETDKRLSEFVQKIEPLLSQFLPK